jgi:hypothetical protein
VTCVPVSRLLGRECNDHDSTDIQRMQSNYVNLFLTETIIERRGPMYITRLDRFVRQTVIVSLKFDPSRVSYRPMQSAL